ncbi:MAG: hypothetical protein A3H32_14345 [Betaproteobacteria bacterium RIFCSPLOWO2_02_FULL_63_19]|nr:MAG: hypothetical protein A3H32_14345 [Betaproteobacteria bacterium RIFCSPLOWO2_02_FULL_63_19]
MAENQKRWLRDYEVEVASAGRFKKSTLRKDRIGAQLFPFHRVGKTVLYDLAELNTTVESARFGGKVGTKARAKQAA